MADLLAKQGIYFDEVDKVCILEPEISKQTNDLKETCQNYVERMDEFQKIANKFIEMVDQLGKEVENQKIKAIGARNILQSMEKQKETNQQQLQAVIAEKSIELERLKIQLNSLQKTEMEQNEIINELTHC
ncbi:intraflagellar transport protein 20 homolog [Tribolium castaneum]|uniref:Intraflagellar transport protein 20 homolog-like Protein n=1 Tax=Tribolium castaneum TaxID=7070 RepID=D6X253_TRICA|nr:PREDICTED: intraflagellar transport protein 20 homolog [Tribolium castaneum]EFA09915.1 Intraflagellar transport protein 20 homolog-like Protein [Tribolium castaneum]|eukprot:XP_967357.1 PREDICTED: intraflagellar transport protein 20 homolog [Tribolium castaneum]